MKTENKNKRAASIDNEGRCFYLEDSACINCKWCSEAKRNGRAVLSDMPGACQTREGPSPHERPQAPYMRATALAALGES